MMERKRDEVLDLIRDEDWAFNVYGRGDKNSKGQRSSRSARITGDMDSDNHSEIKQMR